MVVVDGVSFVLLLVDGVDVGVAVRADVVVPMR